MDHKELKEILEEKYSTYAHPNFVETDPISIPRSYSRKEDIEITAFWTAMLTWGLRKTIINKAKQLFNLMDKAPYDFIMNHKDKDLKVFDHFVHRTFQPPDTLYFIQFFKDHYTRHNSLEDAFTLNGSTNMKDVFIHFHDYFFSAGPFLQRTKKHLASPIRNSTCKRLCMFLRWMVRTDREGIDLNLWKKIKPADLMIPYDVHVDRVGRAFGMIERKQKDWKTVEELTNTLRSFDYEDPVKYDYALFGMGLMERDEVFKMIGKKNS